MSACSLLGHLFGAVICQAIACNSFHHRFIGRWQLALSFSCWLLAVNAPISGECCTLRPTDCVPFPLPPFSPLYFARALPRPFAYLYAFLLVFLHCNLPVRLTSYVAGKWLNRRHLNAPFYSRKLLCLSIRKPFAPQNFSAKSLAPRFKKVLNLEPVTVHQKAPTPKHRSKTFLLLRTLLQSNPISLQSGFRTQTIYTLSKKTLRDVYTARPIYTKGLFTLSSLNTILKQVVWWLYVWRICSATNQNGASAQGLTQASREWVWRACRFGGFFVQLELLQNHGQHHRPTSSYTICISNFLKSQPWHNVVEQISWRRRVVPVGCSVYVAPLNGSLDKSLGSTMAAHGSRMQVTAWAL